MATPRRRAVDLMVHVRRLWDLRHHSQNVESATIGGVPGGYVVWVLCDVECVQRRETAREVDRCPLGKQTELVSIL